MHPDSKLRIQHIRQGRNRISRCRLTNSRVRRYRSVPILKGKVGQIHLRQNENNGE